MQLTFHGHACVRLDGADARIAVDPGVYSDAAAALDGATAVLVTHEHPDHVAPEPVLAALAADPSLEAWATPAAADVLTGAGAPADRVHVATPGETLTLGAARVDVGGGQHAVIHERIPRIENRTYLVELEGATAYHPGDSFDPPPGRVDVLLVPVSAPWLKLGEAIDFSLTATGRVVVPIHNAPLSDVGHALADRLLDTGRLGGDHEYRRLATGDSLWA